MPAKPRKPSRAKQFAQIERISILGAGARMGPLGLWLYASAFSNAASTLPASDKPYEPVPYYLACHSIELSLKAFLSLQGSTMLELGEGAYGHDLDSVLSAAEAKGLGSIAPLRPELASEVRNAATYYAGKVFEYPAVGEALKGYPGLPNLQLLVEVAAHLVRALAQPCREAQ